MSHQLQVFLTFIATNSHFFPTFAHLLFINMALPEQFSSYTSKLFGEKLWQTFVEAFNQEPPVSMRLNPNKQRFSPASDEGGEYDVLADIEAAEPVAWCDNAFYLKSRPKFTFDPLFHAGVYYVQEASSMFLCHVLKQAMGEMNKESYQVLDLCAAPGGKSTLIRSVLPEGSLLFSNEPIRNRANILAENMQKFGHEDVIVTNNYAKNYRKAKLSFDIVVADVPCSGEGMFRKDADSIGEWSENNVRQCSTLQRSIIDDIWPCLRNGGYLVYSTCTYNAHEDEENVKYIIDELGGELVKVSTDDAWQTIEFEPNMYHFIPGKAKGEGFFLALIRKVTGATENSYRQNKKHSRLKLKTVTGVTNFIYGQNFFDISQEGENIVAIPQSWADIYNKVKGELNVLHAGIRLATVKGKNIIPDQSLALSRKLNRENFTEFKLTFTQAIQYLRTEAITLPSEVSKEIVLLTYCNTPIGFCKNLGNRANNLYPQQWRIKSSHI